MKRIKVGIIGAAGYTGSELLRILLHHPYAEIVYALSRSFAGQRVDQIVHDCIGQTDLVFVDEPSYQADLVFLCVAHGEAKTILNRYQFGNGTRVIDLSRDHRNSDLHPEFVYGLPEINREKIQTARNIANPGCFATAIQIGILPLLKKGLLSSSIHINAITGSSGAGMKLTETNHFSNRFASVSVYNVFDHPHLDGSATMKAVNTEQDTELFFVPQRGPLTRGIMASISMEFKADTDVQALYEHYLKEHPFTHFIAQTVGLKNVINTNNCFLNVHRIGNKLLIVSFIDNLIKGASGQAVQNMNLMMGLPETSGLQLKASSI